jgi:hypothetical protein
LEKAVILGGSAVDQLTQIKEVRVKNRNEQDLTNEDSVDSEIPEGNLPKD